MNFSPLLLVFIAFDHKQLVQVQLEWEDKKRNKNAIRLHHIHSITISINRFEIPLCSQSMWLNTVLLSGAHLVWDWYRRTIWVPSYRHIPPHSPHPHLSCSLLCLELHYHFHQYVCLMFDDASYVEWLILNHRLNRIEYLKSLLNIIYLCFQLFTSILE